MLMEPMQKTFHVEAIWDAEAGVFTSRTNIPGLVVEAATIEEFFETVKELAPILLKANHDEIFAADDHQADRGSSFKVKVSRELELACA